MSPEEQREIASKGGQAAHQQGVAHEWTSEEARAAGRKGGQASSGGGRAGKVEKTDSPEQDRSQGNRAKKRETWPDQRGGNLGTRTTTGSYLQWLY